MKTQWNTGQNKRRSECNTCKKQTPTLAVPIHCHPVGFYISTNQPESSSAPWTKPLCQYAAAASEMPYSDTWPSVEGLRTWATKEGGIKFLRTPIWHVSSVALGSYLSYFTVYFTLFHFFPLTGFSPPIAGRSGTKCPSSLSTPLKFGLVRFTSEQTS